MEYALLHIHLSAHVDMHSPSAVLFEKLQTFLPRWVKGADKVLKGCLDVQMILHGRMQ